MGADLLGRNVLAVVGGETIGRAEGDLHDKRAAPAAELEGEKVNLRVTGTAKMGEGATKIRLAEHGKDNFT